MFPSGLLERATALGLVARRQGVSLATAESCTGGLLAALLTAAPGSSSLFERGFVTYSNAAKTELLGVPATLIDSEGAVSTACAAAMARGAITFSRAQVAVSITGIAGPDGGSEGKPVGLVHFGLARRDGPVEAIERRFGPLGRDAIRLAAVDQALSMIEAALRG